MQWLGERDLHLISPKAPMAGKERFAPYQSQGPNGWETAIYTLSAPRPQWLGESDLHLISPKAPMAGRERFTPYQSQGPNGWERGIYTL